jgi:hypothetical protein
MAFGGNAQVRGRTKTNWKPEALTIQGYKDRFELRREIAAYNAG